VSVILDWRGQWLSLHDLAKLYEKSYWTVYRWSLEGDLGDRSIQFQRIGNRIWARIPIPSSRIICKPN
jgi:hypothetical protein